ncbi:MAG: hypothetical protein IJL43_01700 [Lachnospiraceae bacterium]|nr:hypothetical protein [Lachnospiraceae bacterium]
MAEKKTVDEGLLFYLSGQTPEADFAKGEKEPTHFEKVELLPGGVNKGKYLKCDNHQLIAYRAPGNIYAERGTIAFFWRSRIPMGFTPFPVFRVSFADHSSWDQVFLRIDYNGQQQGFDAFVTDINSARLRVTTTMHPALQQMEWVHIAFAWDETVGVKLYLNGILAEQRFDKRVFYAALDQFGPHSRIIANWGVQSSYNFVRGGDLDEVRIYDRMLSDENMAELAACKPLTNVPAVCRSLDCPEVRNEWNQRYGWNKAAGQPQYYEGNVSARKVMPKDAFEHGLWSYKSMDGIRETVWPNMFNRSRLSGRNDYFQLPDWNCYYDSGKEITYTMPAENYNHIEIEGSAFGTLSLIDGKEEKAIDERARFQQYTVTDLSQTVRGKNLHFKNVLLEEPISSFEAFYVKRGNAPAKSKRVQTFYVDANPKDAASMTDDEKKTVKFISDRYLPDEIDLAFGAKKPVEFKGTAAGLPIAQIILPYDNAKADGLDGVAFEIPALALEDTIDGFVNLQITIKDPNWKYRDLAIFTMKVKANEPKKLWIDLRDRIIPADKAMHIVIAASAKDFSAASLQGMKIDLHFKAQKDALKEHLEDAINRVRDVHGNIVEERPGNPKYYMYERMMRDLMDILVYDPKNEIGKTYLYDISWDTLGGTRTFGSPDLAELKKSGTIRGIKVEKPTYRQPKPPKGIEPWAFYQLLLLKRQKYIVDWWIENRMIENGEIGGGLSDDGDQMQAWVALAEMGVEPKKYRDTHYLQMQAYYDQGMFIDGQSMIVADALHSYEDGIQMLTHEMQYEPWNPKNYERTLETLRGNWRICEKAPNGDRQIISTFYSGNKISRDEPWNNMEAASLLVLGPGLNLAIYSGNKKAVELTMDIANMLMHHYHDGAMHANIDFKTAADSINDNHREWANQLYAAYLLTRDEKYLYPVFHHLGGVVKFYDQPASETFDKDAVAEHNKAADEMMFCREYINTLGYTWSDRLTLDNKTTQIQRMGGILVDRNFQYPLNVVTWKFENEKDAELVGIMVPYNRLNKFKVVVFNTSDHTVKAKMSGRMVDPGTWKFTTGLDANGDQFIDKDEKTEEVYFENFKALDVEFAPKKSTIIEMELLEKGVSYYKRPDLAIGEDDVKVTAKQVEVTVHSLGSVDAPATFVALLDTKGKEVARAKVPALAAPNDLYPKTARVIIRAAAKKGYKVVVDPDDQLFEITRINNEVTIG